MENYIPPAKKLRTDDGLGYATSTGDVDDQTFKRKNRNPELMTYEMKCIAESFQFQAENYRGALQEYLQKDGNVIRLTFETNRKIGTDPHLPTFICTGRAGDITATAEGRVKKWARQLAALALLKKMKLVPESYKTGNQSKVEKLPKVENLPKVSPKKTKEDIIAEREIEEDQNIYTGTVMYWKPMQGHGFISIDEDITVNGETAKERIYVWKSDIICFSEEIGLNKNDTVSFKVYKDSLGIGAYEVTYGDGTPIIFEPDVVEEEQAEVVKELVPETIVQPKKKKEMKPLLENKQYINGNFRGALQEYLVKTHPGVTVEFKTDVLHSKSRMTVYVTKCKAVGGESKQFKGLVGTGHAAVKKSAIHFSALDFMLKLNLLTEAQHFQVHQQWSCY